MAIIATSSGKRDPIPEGAYAAVCTRVVDLGTQFNKMFGSRARKILICWEIPECTIEVDGNPMPRMISREFSLTLNDKSALKPFLEAWRGKSFSDDELSGFDLGNVLCAPCQMQIIHNEAGYEKITSIMAFPKGLEKPAPATETIYFDLTDNNCLDKIDKLPDWIKDKIKESPEYREIVNGVSSDAEKSGEFVDLDIDDDDLPF